MQGPLYSIKKGFNLGQTTVPYNVDFSPSPLQEKLQYLFFTESLWFCINKKVLQASQVSNLNFFLGNLYCNLPMRLRKHDYGS